MDSTLIYSAVFIAFFSYFSTLLMTSKFVCLLYHFQLIIY